jgi:hypothetical protein
MLDEDLFERAAVEAALDEQLDGLHQGGHGLGVSSPLARDGETQALGDIPVAFLPHTTGDMEGQMLCLARHSTPSGRHVVPESIEATTAFSKPWLAARAVVIST